MMAILRHTTHGLPSSSNTTTPLGKVFCGDTSPSCSDCDPPEEGFQASSFSSGRDSGMLKLNGEEY